MNEVVLPPAGGKMADDVDEGKALAAMHLYVEAREAEKRWRSRMEELAKTIRFYIETHGELLDGETGFRAWFLERQGTPEWDLTKAPPALVAWAASMGALKVEAKLMRELEDKFAEALDLKRYQMPGRPSNALMVTKEAS